MEIVTKDVALLVGVVELLSSIGINHIRGDNTWCEVTLDDGQTAMVLANQYLSANDNYQIASLARLGTLAVHIYHDRIEAAGEVVCRYSALDEGQSLTREVLFAHDATYLATYHQAFMTALECDQLFFKYQRLCREQYHVMHHVTRTMHHIRAGDKPDDFVVDLKASINAARCALQMQAQYGSDLSGKELAEYDHALTIMGAVTVADKYYVVGPMRVSIALVQSFVNQIVRF